jgi:Spy/CpxP family protein refolding chaperone
MKQNKIMKWVLYISLLLIVPGFAMSQPGPGKMHHEGSPKKNMPDSCRKKCMDDKLAKELSLTDVQKQKISEIHASHFEQMKALREADSICFAKSKDQHQKLRAEIDKEIKQILTDDQKVKFDALKADRKGPRENRPHKGCPYKE